MPLHFVNAEISPAVKLSNGIISHVMTELEITCLPKDLPEFVEIDLANVEAGNSIHLSDITLPKGVTAVMHGGQDNPTIATATIPAGSKADAETPAADASGSDTEKK